jgi:transcriptional regulator with XRE-family HTH domain
MIWMIWTSTILILAMTMTKPRIDRDIRGTLLQSELTQRELAKLIGVSRVTVNRWLASECQPSPAILRYLRKALDVLNTAVDEGLLPAGLPAPHSKTVEDRWSRITAAYDKVTQEFVFDEG